MKQRIVIEIEMVVDAVGTKQTFYAATSGFSTTPTDTPANTYIAPRLKSAGSFKRELFSGTRVTGAVRPSFGEIVLFNGDGGLDDWLGYGVSGGKVTVRLGDEDAAYPAGYTTVYMAYAQHLVADFAEIRVRLRDRLNLLDQPVVNSSFTGTGGLEGSTAMTGKLKQFVSSDPGYFPPILIDSSLQLYFVQSTSGSSLAASFKVYEGAVEIVREGDYADTAACIATSPTIGKSRFLFLSSGVYFRLGSVPKFDLRVLGFGYTSGGSAWTFALFAAKAGISGGTSAINVGARLVDDNSTYLDVMEDSCKGAFGYFGMTRLDQFIAASFQAPDVTPRYTFTQHNANGWSRTPIQDMDAPVWSLNVNAGETWKSNILPAATARDSEYMGRDPWWCAFSKQDASVKTGNPGAVAATVEIQARFFQNGIDQTTFSNTYFALFGVRRDFYTCSVPMTAETIDLELHDTVQIKLPRFGLSAGKMMRIITQQIDCDKRTITYGMWG